MKLAIVLAIISSFIYFKKFNALTVLEHYGLAVMLKIISFFTMIGSIIAIIIMW